MTREHAEEELLFWAIELGSMNPDPKNDKANLDTMINAVSALAQVMFDFKVGFEE